MPAPESKTKSGIVLRCISLGSLEILRQPVHPLSTAEERNTLGFPAESDMLSSTRYKNISKRFGLNDDLYERIFGVEGKYDKFSLATNLNLETGNVSSFYTMPLGGLSGKIDWYIRERCIGANNISFEMELEEWTVKVGLNMQKNSVYEASLMRRLQPYTFTVSASL